MAHRPASAGRVRRRREKKRRPRSPIRQRPPLTAEESASVVSVISDRELLATLGLDAKQAAAAMPSLTASITLPIAVADIPPTTRRASLGLPKRKQKTLKTVTSPKRGKRHRRPYSASTAAALSPKGPLARALSPHRGRIRPSSAQPLRRKRSGRPTSARPSSARRKRRGSAESRRSEAKSPRTAVSDAVAAADAIVAAAGAPLAAAAAAAAGTPVFPPPKPLHPPLLGAHAPAEGTLLWGAAHTRKLEADMAAIHSLLRKRVHSLYDQLRLPERELRAFLATLAGSAGDQAAMEAHIELLTAHRDCTVAVLRAIEKRERLIVLLRDDLRAAQRGKAWESEDGKLRWHSALFDRIAATRLACVEVVELICSWREQLTRGFPFLWRGSNYLLKMASDLHWLPTHPGAALVQLHFSDIPMLIPDPSYTQWRELGLLDIAPQLLRRLRLARQVLLAESGLQASLAEEMDGCRRRRSYLPTLRWDPGRPIVEIVAAAEREETGEEEGKKGQSAAAVHDAIAPQLRRAMDEALAAPPAPSPATEGREVEAGKTEEKEAETAEEELFQGVRKLADVHYFVSLRRILRDGKQACQLMLTDGKTHDKQSLVLPALYRTPSHSAVCPADAAASPPAAALQSTSILLVVERAVLSVKRKRLSAYVVLSVPSTETVLQTRCCTGAAEAPIWQQRFIISPFTASTQPVLRCELLHRGVMRSTCIARGSLRLADWAARAAGDGVVWHRCWVTLLAEDSGEPAANLLLRLRPLEEEED